MASDLMYTSHLFDRADNLERLAGVVGKAFAADMMAYYDVQGDLPQWADVEDNPTTCLVPSKPAAQFLTLFGSVPRVNPATTLAYCTYVARFPLELQAIWAKQFKSDLGRISPLLPKLAKFEWLFR